MLLKKYQQILWRRKWIIFTTVLITTLVVAAGSLFLKPSYQSTATIRVATSAALTNNYNDSQAGDRLINTYVKLATSGPQIEELMKQLNLKVKPEISVSAMPNSELIQITAEDSNPKTAAAIANTLAQIITSQSKQLYLGSSKSPVEILQEQLAQSEVELTQARSDVEALGKQPTPDLLKISAANNTLETKQQSYAYLLDQYDQARIKDALRSNIISIAEPAAVPQTSTKPSFFLNLILGLMGGLVGGFGLASIFENMDTTLYSNEAIESLSPVPVLSKIPLVKDKDRFLAFIGNPPPSDEFRRLRVNLLNLNHGGCYRSLLISSAEPGEGKSTVVANLALALANTGMRVLVIDGDMRLPVIHTYFDLPNKIGLSDLLTNRASLQNVLQSSGISGIHVITGGEVTIKPSELLSSQGMQKLIEELGNHFDFILMDSPAVLSVPDAVAVAPLMNGVLLVVRRERSQREAVQEALQQLAGFKANVVGLVINNGEIKPRRYYDRFPKRTTYSDNFIK